MMAAQNGDYEAQLRAEIGLALKSGRQERVETLRMALAAVKNAAIDGKPLDEAGFGRVIDKMIKQRREAAAQFEAAGRGEPAAKEMREIEILSPFLPERPGEDEMRAAVSAAIADTGAAGIKDMGRVMRAVREKLPNADMAAAGAIVKQSLEKG